MRTPQAVIDLEKRVRKEMEEGHKIGFGCWGVPEGVAYTFTRCEFYNKAREIGVITDEELSAIRNANALIWQRDLSD